MKEITYHKEGDYLIPDLALKNQGALNSLINLVVGIRLELTTFGL